MIALHERPMSGKAADFAKTVSAGLPKIETARLRLRAPRLEDFDAWAEIFCSPAAHHIGGPFTRDDAFVELAASCGMWLLRGFGTWAVEPKAGGEVLGFVLIGFEPGDQEPELGYLFRKTAEGHGYATEAATAARDHAFGALQMDRLASYIDPENAASLRVAQRLGAAHEGEVDGSQVWVHRPTAPRGVSATVKTETRRIDDAKKTLEKGE